LIFLFWIRISKVSSQIQWLSIVSLSGSYIALMWQGGAGWGWFGSYWPKLFLVLFLLCSLISWPKRKRLPCLPKKKVKPWMGLISLAVLTVLFGMGVPSTLTARSYNQD